MKTTVTIDGITAEIEVRPRPFSRNYRNWEKKARIYFGHKGESVIENFGNRAARPQALYRKFLPAVTEALGLTVKPKYVWSNYAGCTCPCSPGFICNGIKKVDVWVTLSGNAPVVVEGGEAIANNRIGQLLSDPTIAGALQTV